MLLPWLCKTLRHNLQPTIAQVSDTQQNPYGQLKLMVNLEEKVPWRFLYGKIVFCSFYLKNEQISLYT